MNKIFIISMPLNGTSDWIGGAIAEDGTALTNHISSNKMWVKHDMGLTWKSSRKHHDYARKYPDGYELVDLVDLTPEELDNHAEYMAACAKNIVEESDEPYNAEGAAADARAMEAGDEPLSDSIHDEGGPTSCRRGYDG